MFQTETKNEWTNPYQSDVPYEQEHTVLPQTPYPGPNQATDLRQPAPPVYPPSGQGLPVDSRPTGQPPARGKRVRRGAIIALITLLTLIFSTGLFADWQFSQQSTATTINHTTGSTQQTHTTQSPSSLTTGDALETVREAVAARVSPAVVEIKTQVQGGQALGSGVIIDKGGYIVTNNHVVNGGQNIQVMLADGSRQTAQLVGTDAADDLAVLKITPYANMTVMTLGDATTLHVGQEVLAIGNPLGITRTVTHGIVSALNRSVSEGSNGATIDNAIQIDAPINPGNSGGALVDLQGNLIGIPTLGAVDNQTNTAANGIGFAIPSNRISTVVHQIIQHGSIR